MNKFGMFSLLLLAALAATAQAAQAQSQTSPRTWVSESGSDTNACTRAAPCRTFNGALAKTSALGVINCLDSGDFRSTLITKSVTIDCHDVIGGISIGNAADGILVNVRPTDRVTLKGLDLEGAGLGTVGIRITGSGQVNVFDTAIRNFTSHGIAVTGGTGTSLFLQDSVLTNNLNGVIVNGIGGGNSALLVRATILRNTSIAVFVAASNTAVIEDAFLAGSPVAISADPGASVQSYGNNVIRNAGLPTVTLPLK